MTSQKNETRKWIMVARRRNREMRATLPTIENRTFFASPKMLPRLYKLSGLPSPLSVPPSGTDFLLFQSGSLHWLWIRPESNLFYVLSHQHQS